MADESELVLLALGALALGGGNKSTPTPSRAPTVAQQQQAQQQHAQAQKAADKAADRKLIGDAIDLAGTLSAAYNQATRDSRRDTVDQGAVAGNGADFGPGNINDPVETTSDSWDKYADGTDDSFTV